MELKEFVSKVIEDTMKAVDECGKTSSRDVHLANRPDRRTIEFDVAVSAEEKTTATGKAGVKVLAFIEAGGNIGSESKNSTVSRITFGVDVSNMTKNEKAVQRDRFVGNRNSQNFAV